jgi:formate hydrogenlyase subunit 6/NADH:ubiquinone oxidoreductase subunit I
MAIETEQEVGRGAARAPAPARRGLPGMGLMKGLGVTLKHLLQRSITQEYPDEKPDLPPRTRGVIALKEANCTVCWKCSRECPDWCIYIEAHKETHTPASGGRGRSVKVLDRFAIDYALCMYCGICVEVCPFDALFWAPDFEYAEYDILEMTHEKSRLEEWTYRVLPPPELESGAEPPAEVVEERPGTVEEGAPEHAQPTAVQQVPAKAPDATPAQAPRAETPAGPAAGTQAAAQPEPQPAAASAAAPPSTAPARAAGEQAHVEPDQETYDRVLQEELGKGTDRRVAEGRAKAAAIRAARRKAGG